MTDRHRFDAFVLDGARGELLHAGVKVPLEPKAFDVLAYLIRHRDRAVPLPELLAAVWAGVNVEPGSVHRAVHFVRRAVSARGGEIEVIRTIPRRGYRFVREVEPASSGDADEPASSYVGRDAVRSELDRRLARARRGSFELVLLHGPPGIGKSATLAWLAARAERAGAALFEGRCIEGPAAPPYRPWAGILRAALRADGPADVADGLAPGTAFVARAIPEIAAALGVHDAREERMDAGAPYRVHVAIADWIRHRARHDPLVLLLDDLQGADLDSIQLLDFLVQELSDEPVLIAAAFRDGPDPAPARRALEQLCARRSGAPIRLSELSDREVAELARDRTGRTWPPPELARLVDSSGGNPLLVEQLLRARDAGPEPETVDLRSAGLRGSLRRLLAGSSASCNEMLSFACVFGREFDPAVLAAGLGWPLPDVQAAIDEAFDRRVLAPRSRDISVRFVHALIPEALYAGLSAAERVEGHRRAVEGLLATRTGSRERLSELAHHACEAASSIGVGPAFDYTVTAARDAMQRLAYEEAIQLFERALSLRAPATPGPAARAACLVDLGTAMVLRGTGGAARPRFFEACALARRLDDPTLLARAALGPSEIDEYYALDHEQIAVLQEAAERLGDRDPALRVQLLIALAKTGYYGARDLTLEASAEALALARSLADPALVCTSLVARAEALGWTGSDDERSALVEDANRIARRARVPATTWGLALRQAAYVALASGDRDGYETRLRDLERLARARRLAVFDQAVAAMRGTLALLEGRFAEAEILSQRQLEIGRLSNPVLAFQAAGVHRTMIQLATGSPEDVAVTMRAFSAQFPEISPWDATLALALAEIGERDEAVARVDALAGRDFEPRHRDFLPITLALLAETVRRLGDPDRAATVADELARLPHRCVVVGTCLATYGAMDRYRGLCAETRGDLDGAIGCYESGLALDERMGALPFVARGLADLGRALRSRGGAEDLRAAEARLDRASALAGRLDMHRLPDSRAVRQP